MPFGNSAPSIASDAGAISGNSFQWGANNNQKGYSWPARSSTPNGRAITILVRFRPGYTGSPAANQGIFSVSSAAGKGPLIEIIHNTAGNIVVTARNEQAVVCLNAQSFGAWSPTSGTWYDLVFRWDGTTTASAAKFDIDASSLGTATASAAFTSSWTNQYFTDISIGFTNAGNTINAGRIDEVVIWDSSLASLSSVGLVSGSGSLNGASRTSLVDVVSFDGASYTDPGVANVLSTVSYTYAGNSQTGTWVAATAANVKTGVSFGNGSTGTYDGSDRWSDPGVANVRSSTAYKANSTSNNRTGTLAVPSAGDVRSGTAVDAGTGTLTVPTLANTKVGVSGDGGTGTYDGSDRWTDPGQANVRSGTAYKANSTSNNKTGTLDLPSTANVKTGVSFDGAGQTGTYDGSDRWTDPGQANVRSGTAYKANSTTNNKTGTLTVPGASDVRSGTAVDASTGSLSVPAASDVRSGVAVDAGTGTLTVPTTSQVKIGVPFGAASALTGTYDGSDRYDSLDPANVKHGLDYLSAGSTETGTYRGLDIWEAVPENELKYGQTYLQNGSSVTGTYTGDGSTPPVLTFRDRLNAILNFIGAESLTDDEYDALTITIDSDPQDIYEALLAVLNARESVSAMTERLTNYFEAKGYDVSTPSPEPGDPGSSIMIGADLASVDETEESDSNVFLGGGL